MFERASREKYRFDSCKGLLSIEDLWDLPLQSKGGFDLDNVAKGVNAELKAISNESFVAASTHPAKGLLERKLDLVKRVIEVKQAENQEKLNRAELAAQRERLQQILATKQAEQLHDLSVEEIQKKLDELA